MCDFIVHFVMQRYRMTKSHVQLRML